MHVFVVLLGSLKVGSSFLEGHSGGSVALGLKFLDKNMIRHSLCNKRSLVASCHYECRLVWKAAASRNHLPKISCLARHKALDKVTSEARKALRVPQSEAWYFWIAQQRLKA